MAVEFESLCFDRKDTNYPDLGRNALFFDQKSFLKDVAEKADYINQSHLDEIGSQGWWWLVFNTNTIRMLCDNPDKHWFDISINLAFALAADGEDISYKLPDRKFPNRKIIEGTNLFIDCRVFEKNRNVKFNWSENYLEIGCIRVSIDYFDNNYNFSHIDHPLCITLCEVEGFYLIFNETKDDARYISRTLIFKDDNFEKISKEIKTIRKLACDKFGLQFWNFIKTYVNYISFTDIEEFETSTNPNEIKNSIIIRRRTDGTGMSQDYLIWIMQGIYHEAKHIQFLESFYVGALPEFWIDKKVNDNYKSCIVSLSSSPRKVGACWRSDYVGRDLSQHLFAAHAFLQGMIVATNFGSDVVNDRVRELIEGELKIVHGCFSILSICREELSESGRILLSKLEEDYTKLLIPNIKNI